mgnify:CR=1 FL=1
MSPASNNGNAADEEGISLSNVSGAVTLSNVTAAGNAYNNLRIDNTAGTMAQIRAGEWERPFGESWHGKAFGRRKF